MIRLLVSLLFFFFLSFENGTFRVLNFSLLVCFLVFRKENARLQSGFQLLAIMMMIASRLHLGIYV